LGLFEKCEAILRGNHLVYTSGRHGSEYVNKDALYPHTEIISQLCYFIAQEFAKERIERVLAPALGGIVLTQWTAHHLQALTGEPVLAVFAEKAETPEGFVLKRGYEKLVPGKRVLILEDILTTGGSVKKVVELTQGLDAEIVAVAALCNRGGIQASQIGAPRLFSLAEISLESWEAADCPLCKKGVPLHPTLGKAKR
jgi:orotate phosphoribosyltransferase